MRPPILQQQVKIYHVFGRDTNIFTVSKSVCLHHVPENTDIDLIEFKLMTVRTGELMT